jgi:hypothetical protein
VDAFDADVIIYAAVPGHDLGRRVPALFTTQPLGKDDPPDGAGSLMLLPEVLGKPLRDGHTNEVGDASNPADSAWAVSLTANGVEVLHEQPGVRFLRLRRL